LDNANPDFGHYSIFQYKGSYNCRHRWVRQVYFAADWEESLNNLEAYVQQLDICISYYNENKPMFESAWDANELLEDKRDEINEALEDFKKNAPFSKKNEVNPIDIPSSMVPADNAATEVNRKVGYSNELKLARAPAMDIFDEGFGLWVSNTNTLEELITSTNAYAIKLNIAYNETAEIIFNDALKIMADKFKNGMVELENIIEKKL